MKIAVTAASGNLGRAILTAVARELGPENAIGICRNPDKAERTGIEGVELRAGDYNDRASYDAALVGVDRVLLVSGNDEPENRLPQHRNVIEAARAAGVERLVYTSIQGAEEGTAFSPIVASNRQTEADLRASGLDFAIGRNGIYIEPDVAYIETYKKRGAVENCAGEGRCPYVTRPELAEAYAGLLIRDGGLGQTLNLHGELLTQEQLVAHLNQAFDAELVYRPIDMATFLAREIEEIGAFYGTIVAGIYQGIALGGFDNPSHFTVAAGRPHLSWDDYFGSLSSQA